MSTPLLHPLLEFELRRIPGIAYVALHQNESGEVTVEVAAPALSDPGSVQPRVEQVCRAHLHAKARVEVHGARRPSRVRLVGVNIPDGVKRPADVIVVVDYEGRMAQGRGSSGDPAGTAKATVEALERLGASVPFRVEATAVFEHERGDGVMLILNAPGAGERYGVATGETPETAAARATLNALNRYLSTQLMPLRTAVG